MKKKLLIFSILSLACVAFYWLLTHAFIEVVIVNPSQAPAIYNLTDQKAKKTYRTTSNSSKIKILVRKGSHEVVVRQGDTSYLTIVRSGSFLSSKTVSASLQKEKARSFVGDNPGPCMNYVGSVLISFSCTGQYNNVQIHLPATNVVPTMVSKVTAATEGFIEGIVETKTGTVVVIKGSGEEPPHTAYIVTVDGKLRSGVVLSNLKDNKNYSVKSYKDGFMVYDDAFESVNYYASSSTKPVNITLGKVDDKMLVPYALSEQNESFAVAYSIANDDEDLDLDNPKSAKTKSEIVISQGSSIKHFTFNTRYAYVVLCGKQKLCLGLRDSVEIYDISGTRQKFLFKLGNFKRLDSIGNNILIVRENEIVFLDPEKQEGSIQYSFEDYTYCGLQITSTGYTLCLINTDKRKVAVAINTTAENSDSIDKKVAQLLKLPEIKTVSAYKQFIFISPDLGEIEFDASTNQFAYNPATKATVNKLISEAIDRIGFDKSKYSIVNVLQ